MADKIPLKLTTGPNEIQEFAAGDTVPKGNLPSTVVHETDPQTLLNKVLADSTSVSTLKSGGIAGVDTLILAKTGGSGSSSDRVVLIAAAPGGGATVRAGSSNPDADLKLEGRGGGNVYVQTNGIAVGTTGTQTLENKTLLAPTIGATDFANANHTHQTGATGGQLSTAALGSGVFNQSFVADAAYRTGSYAFGRGSSVLIDNVAGSGQAQWANRPRVLQVQTAPYTVTPSPTSLQTFSTYSATLNTTGGVTLNSTPDCLKDTTGGSSPIINGNLLTGKLFKVSFSGKYRSDTPSVSSRTITFRVKFVNNATSAFIDLFDITTAPTTTAGYPFAGVVNILFTGAQNGAGTVRLWFETFWVYGTSTTGQFGLMDISSSQNQVAMTILDNSTITISVEAAITSSITNDFITMNSVVYEALN